MFTVQNTLAFIMWAQITIDSFKYTQLPCKTQRDSQRDLQSQIQDNLGFKKMEKKWTNKQTNRTVAHYQELTLQFKLHKIADTVCYTFLTQINLFMTKFNNIPEIK